MLSWPEVNIKIIIRVIGFLLMFEGVFMFLGIPIALYYSGDRCDPLIISGIICILSGLALSFLTKNAKGKNIGKREGVIIVTTSWIIISLFGTLPFILSGTITNFTDAFFETVSGFTTTGATILTDIEAVPKGILFWRSITHWIGGMGIIVLSVAILPILGIGGMQLFVAEIPGPTLDKLHPRITHTAKRLWGIYILLTFVETAFLMFGGMDLFDGLCHAFGTMATGGFSTQNTSIAGYSPYIQYVITVFMILAGTNFTLHYIALHGNISKVWKNDEYRAYIYLIAAVTIIIAVSLILKRNMSFEESFRESIFQTVSIITTTGYITADYLIWPGLLWLILFLMMFVGGCAGSTGGGIKVMRQLLLFKNSWIELKRLLHPNAIIPVKMNGKGVSQDIIFKVMAFFLIYIIIFAFGTMFMSLFGLDFETSIGATIATLGNIGPGLGDVGPVGNYAAIPAPGKWFLSFLMIIGRLELFTVLVLLSPAFWKR